MIVCTACGFESPAGFKFCGRCGAALTAGDAAPQAPTPPRVAARSERRQLTVLFCDVVDSATLAEQLDPEDLREVMRAYHDAAGAVIARFGGHTAQVLGDGLLIYFGYPVAHEDDARRAVHCALELLDEVTTLDERLRRERALSFAVRFGIHTGPVVAGDVSVGASRETLATGQTPNIAARLQALADPNTVFLSGATHRLTLGFFECQPLGPRRLKGISVDIEVYRAIRQNDLGSPFEMASSEAITPMVGRERELEFLLDRFDHARHGDGSATIIIGEPGLGKSRLLHRFRERASAVPHRVLTAYGSPFHQDSALYPIVGMLGTLFGMTRHTPAAERMARLDEAVRRFELPPEEAVPLFAKLLSLPVPVEYPESALAPQKQRERMLEHVVAILLHLAAEQPLVLVIEDLHVADATTLELLERIFAVVPTAAMLVLVTARPTFVSPWEGRAIPAPITLRRMDDEQMAALILRVTRGKSLPPDLERQLIAKADGVPLFLEELTKTVLESGGLEEGETAFTPVGDALLIAVPSTLQDSLTARLDRLGPARRVAEVAAVVGREFGFELLEQVFDGAAGDLQDGLESLERAELVFARGVPPHASYLFKHALIQDAAYGLMLKTARRHYHGRVATALTTRFPKVVELQPELVAHHCAEAGRPGEAITHWLRAGERAWDRSAHQEGMQILRKALAMLPSLPEAERDRHELGIRTISGPILCAIKGYGDAEVGEVYGRALDLCDKVGDSDQRFWAYDGLHSFYTVRGDLAPAHELGQRLLERAEAGGDPVLLLEANYKVAANHFFSGRFGLADPLMERAVELGTIERQRQIAGPDKTAAYSRVISSAILWIRGFPVKATARAWDAIAVARELGHAPSVVGTQVMAATWLLPMLDARDDMRRVLDEAVPAAHQYGLSWWLALGAIAQAHLDVMEGAETATGGQAAGMMRHILAGLHAGGADLGRPLVLTRVAEALVRDRAIGEARAVLDEAIACGMATGQRSWEAEAYRLLGECALQADAGVSVDRDLAQRSFLAARETAREQKAKSFELRAAMSLARFWAETPRRAEGASRLAALYDSFTEGFETADLRAAAATLQSLS